MALSAAFSIAVIIIGVANTSGRIASLNWLARCAGITRSVNVPLAPTGIGRMRYLRIGARRMGFSEIRLYGVIARCQRSVALNKAGADLAQLHTKSGGTSWTDCHLPPRCSASP